MKRNLFKSSVLICIYCIFLQTAESQSPSFQTYMNPVIPGDHPDCTVSQIGDDYYTTGSSFNPTPVIYHSTDLVHWEAIAQPVSAAWTGYGDNPGGGCWGGHIVYYNGKYWDFFSRANTMHFVSADNPEGPWSMPIKINDPSQLSYGLGYDNSIFIDDDNKWYLVVKNGQANGGIVELGNDGQATGVVYDLNWLNPAPAYPYSWAEGPVMWKYKGYYYYSFARDLSGGQKVMRSATLTADQLSWEFLGDFFNESDPLKSTALFTSPNHASNAVILGDSTSWVIHPLYAKGEWRGQGRQGLLNQVRYDANDKPTADYPVNKYFTAPKLPSSGIPWMVPKSDFFSTDRLNPEWSLLGYTPDDKYSLTDRTGWLRLSPKSNKYNTVIKNDGEHNYSLITRVESEANTTADEAGLLILRGDETMNVKLSATKNDVGHKVIRFSFNDLKYETENLVGKIVWLKIIRINHIVSGFYSSNGVEWTQVGKGIDISVIDSYSDFSTFTGTRQGLYVQNSDAYFDLYIYRDAYSQILAECPANQYGTQRTTLMDGYYLLDSIHNNDWALYAGVEFGSTDYPKVCDSVKFIASCASAGGNIEVWLDSIDSGTKIATCEITNTGSWTTFNNFSAKTQRVTGRHDVYLKYTGAGTSRLFQLKWINFIPIDAPRYISSSTSADGSIVEALFNKTLVIPGTPSGFSLVVNNLDTIPITSINANPDDSLSIQIFLQDSIKKNDKIQLSYLPGNFISKDSMNLVQFCDSMVSNNVPGTIPVVLQIITSLEGDAIIIAFTKKMKSPDEGLNNFMLNVNNSNEASATSGEFLNDDSTRYILHFPVSFYYEDELLLKYNGTIITSSEGGVLEAFDELPVTNLSYGYPISLINATMRKYGNRYTVLDLRFDKELIFIEDQKDFFSISINGTAANISKISGSIDSIRLSFLPPVLYGDTVLLSYQGGTLSTTYNGRLSDIVNLPVQNLNSPPVSSVENSTLEKILVFPNPIQGRFTVRSEFNFNELKIYSLFGQVVYSQELNKTNIYHSPDLNLTNGMYFLEIKDNSSSILTRIVVL